MSDELYQQEWIVRLTEGLRRRLALLTGTKALLCAGQKLGEIHLVKVAEAHNAALTTERQRLERVIEETHKLHKAELERLKADFTLELNAKLEQINKQAETIRDERERRGRERDPHDVLKLRAADAMARIVDDMVKRHSIDSRSALADARLDYGQPFKYLEHDQLNQRLLSALAAIEKHNMEAEAEVSEASCYTIDVDLSLLHERDAELIERERQKYIIALRNYEAKHDAEVRKPLVDLRQQLLSALAAIEKHNKSNPTHFGCYSIKQDLSLLHEHDAEVRKPLVDLRQQLLSALAAIEKHNKDQSRAYPIDVDLVDALEKIRHGVGLSGLDMSGIAADALTKESK